MSYEYCVSATQEEFSTSQQRTATWRGMARLFLCARRVNRSQRFSENSEVARGGLSSLYSSSVSLQHHNLKAAQPCQLDDIWSIVRVSPIRFENVSSGRPSPLPKMHENTHIGLRERVGRGAGETGAHSKYASGETPTWYYAYYARRALQGRRVGGVR